MMGDPEDRLWRSIFVHQHVMIHVAHAVTLCLCSLEIRRVRARDVLRSAVDEDTEIASGNVLTQDGLDAVPLTEITPKWSGRNLAQVPFKLRSVEQEVILD